jgi:hypothetical protein
MNCVQILYNQSNKASRLQKQKCRSEIANSLSAMENLATQLHADLDMSTQVQKALEAAETLDKTAGMNRKDFLWTCNFEMQVRTFICFVLNFRNIWNPEKIERRSGWLSVLRRCLTSRWPGFDSRSRPDLRLVWKSVSLL